MTQTDPFELFKALNPYLDESGDNPPDEHLLDRIKSQPSTATGRRPVPTRSRRQGSATSSGATPIEPHVDAMPREASRDNRPWLAVAAAAIVLAGLGGLVALRNLSSPAPTAMNQQPGVPAAAPTVIPAATLPPSDPSGRSPVASTTPAPTSSPSDPSGQTSTSVLIPSEDLSAGAILCVDAGATQRAVALCTEEFGGGAIEAAAVRTESFVMPVDPANPSHVASTARLGADFNLPVRDLDVGLLPVGMDQPSPASTTYLVVGTSDIPYAP